jgi:DNA-binding GntR family transcriptional regulator
MLLSSHTAARPRHSLSVRGAALRADAAFDEPKFYAEAMRSSDADKWREAMDEEIAGFWRNGAWESVDINPIWNILTAK